MNTSGNDNTIILKSIENPTNIHALHNGTSLILNESGLNIIYGDNGSGKSGYARILKKICVLIVLFSTLKPLQAQLPDTINFDSRDIYYSDFSDKLAIRLYSIARSNTLDISKETNQLKLRPNGQFNLGVGFNYKKLGLGISFGIPNSHDSKDELGKSTRIDLQFAMYGTKIGLNGYLQRYKGYYNTNPDDFVEWQQAYYPQLKSLSILSIGASSIYIFNNKKFSYKAAFVRNQIQEKSAGSVVLGLYANYDQGLSDNGFIPDEFPDSLRQEFDLSDFKTTGAGFSFGYIYTLVITKHFFVNLSVLPRFGYQHVDLKFVDKTRSRKNAFTGQLASQAGLGFENQLFYIVATYSLILRSITHEGYKIDLATDQFRFTIGRRFNVADKR